MATVEKDETTYDSTLETARAKALAELLKSVSLDDDSAIEESIDTTYNLEIEETYVDLANSYKQFLNQNEIFNSTIYNEDGTAYNNPNVDKNEVTYSSEGFENANGTLGSAVSINTSTDSTSGSGSSSNSSNTSVNDAIATIGNIINESNSSINVSDWFSSLLDGADTLSEYLGDKASSTSGILSQLTGILSSAATVLKDAYADYNDGVTETSFGKQAESSWRTFRTAVLNNSSSRYSVKQLYSTPFDSSGGNLYGTMMLGVPPLYNDRTDPLNRVTLHTFVKDSRFISLTPGSPKYNGSRYMNNVVGASGVSSYINQTSTFDEMMNYITKNGVDSDNLSKDKRYYTFKADYGKYYSYLETMLNTIWIKMGLAESNGEFKLFSFFKNMDSTDGNSPESQYQSAIGFMVNTTGTVTENITNEKTSIGSTTADTANANSDTYQQINYMTGMGTGGAYGNAKRKVANTVNTATQVVDIASGLFTNTINGFRNGNSTIGKIIKTAWGAAKDVAAITTKDSGATVQSLLTTNGMRVVYPELWRDGAYSKSINFDFNFISPYGDPLSIFKYVYVPFCALLCFTLPRQADDNGYVSPCFVRADIPGLITCDLGIISNMSYTRGGAQGLFTKDGLPRAISGSFTLDDLYPYLAMSRRISYLSANPSYTSFLDSFIGLNLQSSDSTDDEMNDYWKTMLNRVNGGYNANGLWNKFDTDGRAINMSYANAVSKSPFTANARTVNFMRKI